MFNASCPQCGAPVEFKSAAALMVVCPYCRSTLHKRVDDVRLIGRMADVFEDYSPLRIAASGHVDGRGFSVVGRLQLRYDAGLWNEWFIWFDDGASGWLSDASGQYAITERIATPADAELPPFDIIEPGRSISLGGTQYAVSDVRSAECRGGEGELPIAVDEHWTARVVDCRSESAFLTLDFSDGFTPTLYRGRAVELESLAMQGLRDAESIRASAGRYLGDIAPFACPNCGGSISVAAGVADYVYCPSCHAGVDCTEDQAKVFAAARDVERFVTALEVGAQGAFDGAVYTVLGVMRCRSAEGWQWDEYLLHSAGRAFLWLVHSESEWERVSVLDTWPLLDWGDTVRYDNKRFEARETYSSTVTQVIGAFNWRVRAGDTVQIRDFKARGAKLTSETNRNEVVWSRAQSISYAVVAEKFGLQGPAGPDFGKGLFWPLPLLFSILLVVLNIAAYEDFVPDGVMLLLGIVLLWLPEWIGRLALRNRARAGSGGSR
jgi:hypothetical protein